MWHNWRRATEYNTSRRGQLHNQWRSGQFGRSRVTIWIYRWRLGKYHWNKKLLCREFCGGTDNTNRGSESIIGGGIDNLIKQDAYISGIFCGDQNTIDTSADNSAILGGWQNFIGATTFYSAIGGGDQNNIGAGANHTVIVGGSANTASGQFSTVLGGFNNLVSGNYSVAVGRNCVVSHPGSFMWSDGTLGFGTQT